MQQAADFQAETDDLYTLISPLSDHALLAETGFKQWSIETLIRHLHYWDAMALNALVDPEQFQVDLKPAVEALGSGHPLPEFEQSVIPLSGTALVFAWRQTSRQLAEAYQKADPSKRCPWVGPDMSARSCITARQMETWAHGQGIYDVLGRERIETDRVRNIVMLGVNTFGWTYRVNKKTVPEIQPTLLLTAPSGELWQFGDTHNPESIVGDAVGFAQVVTQTRNVADTNLVTTGDVATEWMQTAQCFAGGATKPPAPGVRCKAAVPSGANRMKTSRAI